MTEAEIGAYLEALQASAREWRLTPVQQKAEQLSTEVDQLLYGGAAGGGKTEWMLWHAYEQCIKYPGLRVLGVRRTFPQLRKSLIERSLLRYLAKKPTVCKYMPSEKAWRFDNGSEITFGFCDAPDDYRHYLSAEYDIIMFEELTEFTEMQFKMIASRCRTTTKKLRQGIRPHVIAATNPGQIGHDWVLKYFIRPTDYGKQVAVRTVEVDNKTMDRLVAFVPAKVSDNPHIDPNYIFNLGDLDEHKRKQYLEGDWDAFEGQFFYDFDKKRHVIKPFTVPASWPRVRGIDYGSAKPYSCVWVAFDHDGNAIVYRMTYETKMTASEQAKQIVRLSKHSDAEEHGRHRGRPEEFFRTVADPSTFNKQGSGTSIAQMYALEGLHVAKAMNARVDGWNRIRDYLRGDNHPQLYIFDTCRDLIDELTFAVVDDQNPEDLDTTGADHSLDALRYALAARGRQAKKKKDVAPPWALSSRLDAIMKDRRQQRGNVGF